MGNRMVDKKMAKGTQDSKKYGNLQITHIPGDNIVSFPEK